MKLQLPARKNKTGLPADLHAFAGILPLPAWHSRTVKEHVGIVILLLVYIALGCAYEAAAPFGVKPDEWWHLSYVEYLEKNHSLPAVNLSVQGFSGRERWQLEAHQPPLYYGLVALLNHGEDFRNADALYLPNPHFLGTAWGNINLWLPTRNPALAAVHLGRFVSLFFGVLTILSVYGTVRTFTATPTALLAAALLAFNPQFLFIATTFSNDLAVTSFCGLTLWATADGAKRVFKLWRCLLIGALIGLATLSKVSGLALLAVIPVFIAVDWYFWHRGSVSWRRLLVSLSLLCGAALALPSLWFWRNWQLYHDPFAMTALHSIMGERQQPVTWGDVRYLLTFLWHAYWLDFSPGGVIFGDIPNKIYTVVSIAAALALPAAVYGWRRLKEKCWLLLLLGLWVLVYFAALMQTLLGASAPLGGGRLAFPIAGAVTAVIAIGLTAVWPQRYRWPFVLVLSAFSLGLGIFAYTAVLRPAYSVPQLPMQSTASLPHHADAQFGNLIGLEGWSLPRQEYTAGDMVELQLYWQRLQPIEENYTVFAQLWPDGQGFTGSLGQVDTHPGLGIAPTSLWPEDKVLADRYPIPLNADVSEPVAAKLAIGFYRADTGERLPVSVSGTAAGDSLILTEVVIRPRQAVTIPKAALLVQPYQFAAGVELGGCQLLQAADEEQCLQLWWRGGDGQREDYTVFVHLLGADGAVLGQSDALPANGRFPTSLWRSGDVIRDEHCFPATVLAQAKSVRLGLYNNGGQRLPAYDATGSRLIDDAVVLALR